MKDTMSLGKKHSTQKQLYGHLPPIFKTVQRQWIRHAETFHHILLFFALKKNDIIILKNLILLVSNVIFIKLDSADVKNKSPLRFICYLLLAVNIKKELCEHSLRVCTLTTPNRRLWHNGSK